MRGGKAFCCAQGGGIVQGSRLRNPSLNKAMAIKIKHIGPIISHGIAPLGSGICHWKMLRQALVD